MNIKSLITIFKSFTDNHPILKTFSWGNLSDYSREDFITEYPAIHFVPVSSTLGNTSTDMTFSVLIYDLLNEYVDDPINSNQLDSMALTQEILNDFVNGFINQLTDYGYYLQTPIQFNGFTDRFKESVCGVEAQITITMEQTSCIPPFILPSPTPTPSPTSTTPTPTPTPSITPTITPTLTSSPTPTPTLTSSPTPTPTITSISSPTPTPTITPTPTPGPAIPLLLYLDAAESSSYPGSGSTWFDISGNGNDADLYGGIDYVSSGISSYFGFSGNTDYAVISGFSMSNNTSLEIMLSWYGPLSGQYNRMWSTAPNDNFELGVSNSGGISNYVSSGWRNGVTSFGGVGVCRHFVFTYSGSTMKVYRDGTLVNTTNIGSPMTAGANTYISRRYKDELGFEPTEIDVKYIKVYDAILDATQVSTAYSNNSSRC